MPDDVDRRLDGLEHRLRDLEKDRDDHFYMPRELYESRHREVRESTQRIAAALEKSTAKLADELAKNATALEVRIKALEDARLADARRQLAVLVGAVVTIVTGVVIVLILNGLATS